MTKYLLIFLISLNCYSQKIELIGEDFFKLFKLDVNTENKYYNDEIYRKDKVYINYTNEFSQYNAAIRLDGIPYNMFHFKLENDARTIKEVMLIQAAGDLPEISLMLNMDQPGFNELAMYYNIAIKFDKKKVSSYAKSVNKYKAEYKAKQETLANFLNKTEYEMQELTDSDNALGVLMHQFSIMKYDNTKSINALKTYGADTCVILIIYDKKEKIGMLAHIDGMTDIENSLNKIKILLSNHGSNLKVSSEIFAYMIGGDQSSIESVIEIEEELKKFNLIKIYKNTLRGKYESAWLDLKEGKVFSFKVNNQLKSNKIPKDFDTHIRSQILSGKTELENVTPESY